MRVVIAKGVSMRPAMLDIIASGSMTMTLVPAEASTATLISPAPIRAASQRLSISSNLPTMFSSTTIELETSTPVDKPMARRVGMFKLCPLICMKNRLMMMVTGIVTATMNVVRRFTKKMKSTTAHKTTACQTLPMALEMDWRICADSSETHVSSMPPGRVF